MALSIGHCDLACDNWHTTHSGVTRIRFLINIFAIQADTSLFVMLKESFLAGTVNCAYVLLFRGPGFETGSIESIGHCNLACNNWHTTHSGVTIRVLISLFAT